MSKKTAKFSAIGFILSSIGAAVGLGNIWRFPQQMVDGGGASFIIIYFLILLLVCLPIFLLELNYGVFFGKGVVKCFGKNRRFLGTVMGWKQTMLITFLCFYYLVVIAWVGIAFILSLVPGLFETWSQDKGWFNAEILKTASAKEQEISNFSNLKFSPWVLISMIVILVLVCGILSAGVKNGLEKANYVFVPGLFVMLIGLTVYAVFFLKDGKAGLEVLFDFNFQKMNDGKIWFEATKQGIFSTGILIGILIVFGKNADVRMDKNNEAILVVLFDTFIALIAGLLVISLISHDVGKNLTNTNLEGKERTEKIIQEIKAKFNAKSSNLGGSQLLFAYLPGLFWTINGSALFGWGNFLMIVFTITLLFAALSSIIAMLEVGVDALEENFNMKKRYSVGIIGTLALFCLGFYSTSLGPSLVGQQDMIILLFITIVGVIEIFILVTNKQYQETIQTNDSHSFLKLARFNWLKVVLYTFTVPVLVFLSVFGVLEITGVMHTLQTDHAKYVNWLGMSGNTSAFVWNSPKLISFSMFGLGILLTAGCSSLSLSGKFNNKTKKLKI